MIFERYAGMASAVGIVLILTLIAWLDLWGPVNVGVIREWQTLIGFGGTLAVGCVAWINVTRQIRQQRVGTRLTLLSREEDRIEKSLPGLKDAAKFCENLSRRLSSVNSDIEAIVREIRDEHVGSHPDRMREAVSKLLPATDEATRQSVISRLQILVTKCLSASIIFESGRTGAPYDSGEVQLDLDASERYERQMNEVREAIRELAQLGEKLGSKTRWSISQLQRIRMEIEATII
jgi:hypothetical protein